MSSLIYFTGGKDRLTATVEEPSHAKLVNLLKNQGWAVCRGNLGAFAVNAANVALIVDQSARDAVPVRTTR
jgi:hypothetical protein